MASFYRRSSTDGVLLLTMKPLSFYYKFLCKPGGGEVQEQKTCTTVTPYKFREKFSS